MTEHSTHTSRPLARIAAFAVGALFLVVGILGFLPGATTGYDTLDWAGHHSEAEILGVFQVSILHNAVHLLFGVAGVVMARTAAAARLFLLGGGLIYLLLWLYGLIIDQDSAANFIPVNTADNWLHLGLGIAMLGLGLLTSGRAKHTAAAPTSP
ncbi:DUF4383 domain-containing protein [Rhodococcus sp. WAY2]|uniref:DUF4383 domain-containing protein n=1 Tax=Rhodococcus sp. WAY2 TaxID=2663121 RepID=UPI001358C9F2|nr:DUF4383 domain-containing protein [Rhodococcus sp. WAY2]